MKERLWGIMKKWTIILLLGLWSLPLGGCFNLSPRYAPPAPPGSIPSAYKEEDGWKTAQPRETVERGPWWRVFSDPTLNGLMDQANTANQNIAVAAANLRQARSQISIARSALLPIVSAPASLTRSGSEGQSAATKYSYGFSAQWEISFWNAVPAFEAAKAQAEASAADYATMRLATQAELAQAYFQLRGMDGQTDLYESTIEAYKRAVALTRSQFLGGLVTRVDLDQAETQLAAAQAQLAGIKRQRAELEHGIAILTGQMPSAFSLPRASLASQLPAVPTGLPSELLERRPDVAGAERRVAVANEQIGLARAAWFPSLTLGGDYLGQAVGFRSAPVWTWSVGPSAALTLFQGGRRLAESDSAWAVYEAEVATYRQTVLEAFKDVEDNLSALRYLALEAEAQGRAVQSSLSALRLATSQYQGGLTTYLQVVTSQTTALSNERSAIEVQTQRLVATVNLIKALGGSFSTNELPGLVDTPPTLGAAER